ncbi:hypothetical protein E2562_024103 [Oryza meyeriana var. granulata]|uniref:Uncharacterized protein n=1 Tax=Oryza meyeriana var. granulata TaxID=110450 RepID=A0A6G1CI19_9ORYZ|nr:hypothetical protein E2562_024103 [Oryza meyeriana var. granulata]
MLQWRRNSLCTVTSSGCRLITLPAINFMKVAGRHNTIKVGVTMTAERHRISKEVISRVAGTLRTAKENVKLCL